MNKLKRGLSAHWYLSLLTTFQCNTSNLWMNRVSVPPVRSKMAITLELKLCLSNFIRGKRDKKVIEIQILL